MAYEFNITAAHKVFYDTDNILRFEAYEGEPTEAEILAGTAVPLDVTGYDLSWMLKRKAKDAVPLISKATGGNGITISGTYNVSPASNTQVIEVIVRDTDTYDPDSSPAVDIKPGTYVHALKRTGDAVEKILAFGTFVLRQAAAWE